MWGRSRRLVALRGLTDMINGLRSRGYTFVTVSGAAGSGCGSDDRPGRVALRGIHPFGPYPQPDFRHLFLAELVVFGADWFVMVPLLVLLPELTGSGVWGALVLAVDTGIVALLLPYTGTIADRLDRRKIMIAANLAALRRACCCCSACGRPATASLALVAIGAVAVAKAFYSPAAQAALPNVRGRRRPRRRPTPSPARPGAP